MPQHLHEADLLISSTGARGFLVERPAVERALAHRRRKPMVMIGLAVPRDIDPACAELDGVSLYDVDDLQAVVARNLTTREGEVPRAEDIVEQEIHRFAGWLGQLEALPTVTALREHGNVIVDRVLAENAGRWESASTRDLARVETIARAVYFAHQRGILHRDLKPANILLSFGRELMPSAVFMTRSEA